jgi:arylsulfatase A-like enzyme
VIERFNTPDFFKIQSNDSAVISKMPTFKLKFSPSMIRIKRLYLTLLVLVISHQSFAQKPNIIYIMTDDMGYGDLSSYGCKDYQTPNLDKLASQGIRFLNAYSGAPVCTPTRVAFMTGRYPARTPLGLIEPLTGFTADSTYGLTPDYPSVGSLMKRAGYQTALIGKWHLGFKPEYSPNKNGFDYFYGIHSGAADYISHVGTGYKHDFYENETAVSPKGYLTHLISQKAVQYLKQKKDKPFFLSVMFTAPHWPWQRPDDEPYPDSLDFRVGGSRAIYAEMMKQLDQSVGAIMKTLDDEQLANETIVIFTNDNGGERYSDNGGLSKSKMSLWEGGIRVPAFVRWPNRIKAGRTTEQVAVTMDWTATILKAGGAKASKDFPLDGIDLMPVLTSDRKPIERTLYWRTFQRDQQKAMRMGDWKYLKDTKGEYLFNVATDSGEKTDLKTTEPATFDKLKKMYALWEKGVLAPVSL